MKPNILCINPPSIPLDIILEDSQGIREIEQPLSIPVGILYLSSYIKKYNDIGNVGILDFPLHINEAVNYKKIEDFILQLATKNVNFTPDILAYSLIFSSAHGFFNLSLRLLKSIWPKTVTIVGGAHATNCTKKLLENENVDFVFRGEGELAFSEFIKKYPNLKQIQIKGIYSKDKIKADTPLEICDYVVDLDKLPFPDWDLIEMEVYINASGRKRNIAGSIQRKIATIMTTRGCPFVCTFCSSHTVHGRKVRFRSVENVVEEVRLLHKRYGVTLFIPEDDLFTADKKRVLTLLSRLKGLRIADFELQFPDALSVNALDEQIIDALISSGMEIATLAIESGSEYVQKYIIKKNCNLKKAKDAVNYLKKKGIIVRCYFMLGFPGETKEQMQETIAYAKALGADWCVFNIATPLTGTEMYEQFLNLGYIHDDIDVWSKALYQERHFDTKEISAKELKELAYRENLEINFIHNPNMTGGNFNRAIEIFNDIVIKYPFHIIGWYCLMQCYQNLKDFAKMKQIDRKIRDLIKSDARSTKMFHNYKDLMSDFKLSPDETTGVLFSRERL